MALNLALEGKPWYYGLGIGLAIVVLAVGLVHYFLVIDMNQKIKSAETQLAELDNQIAQGRSAERKLPQFREEVKRLELELEKLRRILPSTRNTEEIIKKMKALVDQGDFALIFLQFPKFAPQQGSDPYVEWPIKVEMEGGYHNLAILFNRLSNFSRIVDVEEFTITALAIQLDKTIKVNFTAKTFVYQEPKEPETKAPALSKAPGK
jgi:type IV pilus assembly protein PilO